MRSPVLGLVVAVMGCKGDHQPSPEAKPSAPVEVSPPQTPPPAPSPRPAPPPPDASPQEVEQEKASIGVATFKGDRLTLCILASIAVAKRPESAGAPFSSEQLAILMVAMFGEGAFWDQPKDTSAFLAAFAFPGTLTDDQRKKMPAAVKQFQEAKLVSWPPSAFAKPVAKGDALRSDSCEFPGKSPLATCEVRDELPGFLAWDLLLAHYDAASTTDSDLAMKLCMKIGGKFEVASGSDADMERLHQHSADLNEKLDQLRGEMGH